MLSSCSFIYNMRYFRHCWFEFDKTPGNDLANDSCYFGRAKCVNVPWCITQSFVHPLCAIIPDTAESILRKTKCHWWILKLHFDMGPREVLHFQVQKQNKKNNKPSLLGMKFGAHPQLFGTHTQLFGAHIQLFSLANLPLGLWMDAISGLVWIIYPVIWAKCHIILNMYTNLHILRLRHIYTSDTIAYSYMYFGGNWHLFVIKYCLAQEVTSAHQHTAPLHVFISVQFLLFVSLQSPHTQSRGLLENFMKE